MKKILVAMLLLVAANVSAQTDQSELATQAFQRGKWSEAIQLSKIYRSTHQFDVPSLLTIGISERHLGNYKNATTYLDSVFLLSGTTNDLNQARFQLAKCYIALKEKDKAFHYLDEAADHGGTFYSALNDTLFYHLRNDTKFQDITDKFKLNSAPGTYDPRYQKFKFFIGIWDVYLGTNFDQKVAIDTVTLSEGGYAVFENFKWTRGGSYAGRSMTFFDPATQKYRMCWAGSTGDIRNFEEVHAEQNLIQLLAVTNDSENQLVHRRMTMTYNPSDNSVHQYIENSTDMGKTWKADFDAMFKKAK